MVDEALVQLLDAARRQPDDRRWRLAYPLSLQRAYLIRPFTRPAPIAFEFRLSSFLDFPDWGGRLRFNLIANGGLRQVALTGGLTLRPRQVSGSLPQNGVNKTHRKTCGDYVPVWLHDEY